MRFTVALCLIVPLLAQGEALDIPDQPRPLHNAGAPPTVQEISLGTFDIQDTAVLHAGPGLFDIDGEPQIGRRYPLEAYIAGEQAIRQARFDIVDERGELIEPLIMARKGTPGSSRYVGMMTVPNQPFRVVLTGESVGGQPFRRVHRRLFRPVARAPSRRQQMQGLAPDEAAFFQRMLDEADPLVKAQAEAEVAGITEPTFAMPQMRVSNVTYAPLLSPAGRPRGIRISYEATFSHRSEYAGGVGLELRDDDYRWRGMARMQVADSRVEPIPHFAHQPYGPFTSSEFYWSPLEHGGTFIYEPGIIYRFTADFVPEFIVHNLERTRTCIAYQMGSPGSKERESLQRLMVSEQPATYLVVINSPAFKAEIRNFYPPSAFRQTYVSEGAEDCGATPSRRF
jgi:hypothetical protein